MSEKQLKDHHLYKSRTGEILLDVHPFLIWNYIGYFCCICIKKTKFSKYKEITELGSATFKKNLDLIFLTKRLKMHSIAFYRRLSQKDRKLAAQLANLRPLQNEIDYSISSKTDNWEKIDDITFLDRFICAFQIRFSTYFENQTIPTINQ